MLTAASGNRDRGEVYWNMVAFNIFFNLLAGSAWVGLVILLDTHRREKKS
jgi:hypothetical protein